LRSDSGCKRGFRREPRIRFSASEGRAVRWVDTMRGQEGQESSPEATIGPPVSRSPSRFRRHRCMTINSSAVGGPGRTKTSRAEATHKSGQREGRLAARRTVSSRFSPERPSRDESAPRCEPTARVFVLAHRNQWQNQIPFLARRRFEKFFETGEMRIQKTPARKTNQEFARDGKASQVRRITKPRWHPLRSIG